MQKACRPLLRGSRSDKCTQAPPISPQGAALSRLSRHSAWHAAGTQYRDAGWRGGGQRAEELTWVGRGSRGGTDRAPARPHPLAVNPRHHQPLRLLTGSRAGRLSGAAQGDPRSAPPPRAAALVSYCVTVTNDRKLSGVTQHPCIILLPQGVRRPQSVSLAEARCWGRFLGELGESAPCLLLASGAALPRGLSSPSKPRRSIFRSLSDPAPPPHGNPR